MRARKWEQGWAAVVLVCGCGGKSVEHAAEGGVGGAAGGLQKGASSALDAGHGGQSCQSNDLLIDFQPDMYSAYIEGSSRVFKLPVEARVGQGPTARWSASDPTIVEIQPDPAGGALLTMQRAGDVIITANANGQCGTSTLHITAATEEQWQAGNARYNDMYPLPEIETDGGVPVNLTNVAVDVPGMPAACTNCHGEMATRSVFGTITPAPLQTGGLSDSQLIDIITKGAVSMNDDLYFAQIGVPASTWSTLHTWSDISGEQAQGMVVYLRSLIVVQHTQPDIPRLQPPRKSNSDDAGAAYGARGSSDGGASDTGAEAGK
jgi:hypothetical protein